MLSYWLRWGDLFGLIILLVVIFLFLRALLMPKKDELAPPLPGGWLPILGHMWLLDPKKPFETIDRWSRELGDIFCVYFGTTKIIILSRSDVLKEAFLKDGENFSGRPKLYVHESCWGRGYIISDGRNNTEFRKFLMISLRQRQQFLFETVRAEVCKMLETINDNLQNGCNQINIMNSAFYVIGNVLTTLLFGRTYPHGSQEFREKSQWLKVTLKLMEQTAPLTFLPWLRYMPPDGFGYWKLKKQANAVHQIMMVEIQKRLKTREYEDLNRLNIVDVFLRRMKQIWENPGSTDEERENFTVQKLVMLMAELYFAAIQTECDTVGWIFLYMVENQQIQDKCRQQILDKIGRTERIKWDHRKELPYLEATIMEVQRCACVAPFGLFHRNFRATSLHGYRIPADSMIMMNLFSTMNDPERFSDPYSFIPERFLDGCGKIALSQLDGFYPFSLGNRMCLGEQIARCELFVIAGSLLQNYRFRKIPGHSYSLEKRIELTIHPDDYELLIEPI